MNETIRNVDDSKPRDTAVKHITYTPTLAATVTIMQSNQMTITKQGKKLGRNCVKPLPTVWSRKQA